MQCFAHEPVRVPNAVQRERTQTSVRSLRKLDCRASGAPLVRDQARESATIPGRSASRETACCVRPGNAADPPGTFDILARTKPNAELAVPENVTSGGPLREIGETNPTQEGQTLQCFAHEPVHVPDALTRRATCGISAERTQRGQIDGLAKRTQPGPAAVFGETNPTVPLGVLAEQIQRELTDVLAERTQPFVAPWVPRSSRANPRTTSHRRELKSPMVRHRPHKRMIRVLTEVRERSPCLTRSLTFGVLDAPHTRGMTGGEMA